MGAYCKILKNTGKACKINAKNWESLYWKVREQLWRHCSNIIAQCHDSLHLLLLARKLKFCAKSFMRSALTGDNSQYY